MHRNLERNSNIVLSLWYLAVYERCNIMLYLCEQAPQEEADSLSLEEEAGKAVQDTASLNLNVLSKLERLGGWFLKIPGQPTQVGGEGARHLHCCCCHGACSQPETARTYEDTGAQWQQTRTRT